MVFKPKNISKILLINNYHIVYNRRQDTFIFKPYNENNINLNITGEFIRGYRGTDIKNDIYNHVVRNMSRFNKQFLHHKKINHFRI